MSAEDCNIFFDSIHFVNGILGDKETALGRKCPTVLIFFESEGRPSPSADIERVRRLRHTLAAEVVEMQSGFEGKPG